MNFLCHARAHLDRPHETAGTAAPDWLRILGRRFRLDPGALRRPKPDEDSAEADLLRGIHQHFEDDAWFHQTQAFHDVTRAIAADLRAQYAKLRASFFSHILLEMLLDAWLMEQNEGIVDRYYAALDALDVAQTATLIDGIAGRSHPPLPVLIRRFRSTQFIRSYGDDAEVTMRLGQVGRRMRQPPLPDDFPQAVARARGLVFENAAALLAAPQG